MALLKFYLEIMLVMNKFISFVINFCRSIFSSSIFKQSCNRIKRKFVLGWLVDSLYMDRRILDHFRIVPIIVLLIFNNLLRVPHNIPSIKIIRILTYVNRKLWAKRNIPPFFNRVLFNNLSKTVNWFHLVVCGNCFVVINISLSLSSIQEYNTIIAGSH